MTDAAVMYPPLGSRQRFLLGDVLEVRLDDPRADLAGRRGILRTSIGGASGQRAEAWRVLTPGAAPGDGGWRDVPMQRRPRGWSCRLRLTEAGCFAFKARAAGPGDDHDWPPGPDAEVVVHPLWTQSGCSIYCAFARQFGPTRTLRSTRQPLIDDQLLALERHGYAVLPPSGTLRDVVKQCPHIFERLGCRILHLLPITPTPTTYARYGRFGSPYAATDFTAIDPALVEFDRRTTGVDQFRELADAVHRHDGRLFLDLAINHTGWGSRLQEQHPEWFVRQADGTFTSPGAWGTVWEDLVELDHGHPPLWTVLAEVFLTWCARGVDGFRCDAGYMIPTPAWRAITARVQEHYPDTVFLLEGLGGAWETTRELLGTGGMQWAYSELFQNHTPEQVSGYLDHCLTHDGAGLLVHYSETHDNDRLAARGRRWALARHRLCALLSHQGAWGFTAGGEWLADEKIRVHQANGLNWDAADHIVGDIATLNHLLADHPCFAPGAALRRLSSPGAALLVVERTAEDGTRLLVCANLDQERAISCRRAIDDGLGPRPVDLLEVEPLPADNDGIPTVPFAPGQVRCLAAQAWRGATAGARRRASAAVWDQLLRAARYRFRPEDLAGLDRDAAVAAFIENPEQALAVLLRAAPKELSDFALAVRGLDAAYRPVICWDASQLSRVVPIPPDHAVLLRADRPFRATVTLGKQSVRLSSAPLAHGHAAVLPPLAGHGPGSIELDHFDGARACGPCLFLHARAGTPSAQHGTIILLGNGRGAMLRMPADLGGVRSKYDAVLAANLHPELPVDRQVLVKSVHAWLRVDGIGTPLCGKTVRARRVGTKAVFDLLAPIGGGEHLPLRIEAALVPERNTVLLAWELYDTPRDARSVHLVVRLALEDRSYHGETVRNAGVEAHFRASSHHHGDGFSFTPYPDRTLVASLPGSVWRAQEEWWTDLPHPHEATRGQRDRGDAYSPGFFTIDLRRQARAVLCLDAEAQPLPTPRWEPVLTALDARPAQDLDDALERALDVYVVRRGTSRTVIAGYPWFLDWGRDSLIAARGLLNAGRRDAVVDILRAFGAMERGGTLPNTLNGGDTANRETSDAPLWYAVVVEELLAADPNAKGIRLDDGRDLIDVCLSIAHGYLAGTVVGVRCDRDSGLVWSPSHYTWMDTAYPMGTPREGHPIEIQALWWRLLRLLDGLHRAGDPRMDAGWGRLADQVATAIATRYVVPRTGWLGDCLRATANVPSASAALDDALRPNALLAIALGAVSGAAARTTVRAAIDHLIVPGAIRTLAPLPVTMLLPIIGTDGRTLGDPQRPYRGRYEGDEDTRRKPAYHNGSAWVWPFPSFCEALLRLWPGDPWARAAAASWLDSVDRLLDAGCIGHLPELLDGDAPHTERGCDAQAWSATEVLRVRRLLAD